jgi:hypothetical protein
MEGSPLGLACRSFSQSALDTLPQVRRCGMPGRLHADVALEVFQLLVQSIAGCTVFDMLLNLGRFARRQLPVQMELK